MNRFLEYLGEYIAYEGDKKLCRFSMLFSERQGVNPSIALSRIRVSYPETTRIESVQNEKNHNQAWVCNWTKTPRTRINIIELY